METGPLALPAGRLRLLGRAWTEPVPDGADASRPVLRIELAPQHAEPSRPDPLGLAPPAAREPVDEGLVFRRLALTLQLDQGHAVVIIPERPDVVWGKPAPPPGPPPADLAVSPTIDEADRPTAPFARIVRDDPASAGEDSDADTEPAETRGPRPSFRDESASSRRIGPAGPRAPRLPTLGEAMLMSPVAGVSAGETGGASRVTRAVVVLIPRLPDEFRLLSR
jgi:hypothetical protein